MLSYGPPPHRSYGRITGYDVNFVNPGSDNIIVAKGNRELFHVIEDAVSVSNQERVMVQVGYITIHMPATRNVSESD